MVPLSLIRDHGIMYYVLVYYVNHVLVRRYTGENQLLFLSSCKQDRNLSIPHFKTLINVDITSNYIFVRIKRN